MFLALLPAALAGTWPPGSTIDPGISADITKEGFDAIAELIPSFLPPSIEIPDTGDSYAGVLDQCWLGGYAYSITNANVTIEVVTASITPADGYLAVHADLLVSLNDPSDPFQLFTSLECLDDTCDGYVNPFPVTIDTTLALSIVDDGTGTKTLDATVGEMVVNYEIDGATDINFSGCTIGDIEEVLNYVGISIYDLILGMVGGVLESQIQDMGTQIEEAIEDAFASATIEQDLELGDAVVHLKLQPSNVQVTDASLRLWLEGSFDGDAATCVSAYDPGGSLRTDSELPDPMDLPSGVSSDYHASILVGDDFANSALYALWRSGLLCYTLDENGPIALDTSMLNLLTDDAFAELFSESAAVTLITRPEKPPEVAYTGEHDLGLTVEDMGLDFYAELDGRQARLVSLSLDAVAGADLALNDATGELAIALDISGDNVSAGVGYNEIAPEANEAIVAKFSGLFDTLVGSLVGGLLDSLAFGLPSFNGIGLQSIEVAANGSEQDWLGVYTWLGPVEYGSGSSCGGCGGDTGGGTDTGGGSCGGGSMGCTVGPFAPWSAIALSVLVARRRRA